MDPARRPRVSFPDPQELRFRAGGDREGPRDWQFGAQGTTFEGAIFSVGFREAKGAPTFRSARGRPERLSLGKFARPGELGGGCPHKGAQTAACRPGRARLSLGGREEQGTEACSSLVSRCSGVVAFGAARRRAHAPLFPRPPPPALRRSSAHRRFPGPIARCRAFPPGPLFPSASRLAGCSTWRGSSLLAGEEATRFVDGAKAWLMWISLKPPVVSWFVEATSVATGGCVQGSHCVAPAGGGKGGVSQSRGFR